MKKPLLTWPLLALLTACSDAGTNTPNPSGATDSVGATAPASTSDTTITQIAAELMGKEFPTVKPGDIVEDVIPPDESDSLKFCYIINWTEKDGKLLIDADYMQLFYGDKALSAAKKRNDAEVSVVYGDSTFSIPGDIYMLNENKRIRQLTVAKEVRCFTIALGDSKMVLQQTNLQNLRINWNPEHVYILIQDKNNIVTTIKEQYLP